MSKGSPTRADNLSSDWVDLAASGGQLINGMLP